MRIALVLLLLLLPGAAAAEQVVAALNRTRIAITTGFSGSEIFIYGAVKREAPAPESQLDVIVTVTGPSAPVVVRRKERNFGIWMNGEGVRIDAAPSFYAVATTRPFERAITYTDDLRHRVGLWQMIRLIDAPAWLGDGRDQYLEALVRLRAAEDRYFIDEGGVRLTEDTLFSTRVELPANLVEGDYQVRVFLMRDREVADMFEAAIAVRKEGIERLLYLLAHQQSLVYGIGSVVVALIAGWLASAIFRVFVA